MYIRSKQTTTWQDKRINAMNKIIKQSQDKSEALIEEYNKINSSKAENKKQYKGESNAST